MKVYYINSFLEGCWYVRSYLPMVAGGWDGDRLSLRTEIVNPQQKSRGAADADVVVFHRPNSKRDLDAARLIRQSGKKIVFDNDDTYKGIDAMKLGKLLKEIDVNIDNFVKEADLVTCSTEFLAEEYRQLNKNVVVLPNCVDPSDWPDPLRNDTDKVRIGFVGSVALNGDFDGFRPTLEALCKRSDVQVVLFSLPPMKENQPLVNNLYRQEVEYWTSLNVEWQPFVDMKEYFDTLNNLKLDLMIIPRKDDYFNRCKSNIKFLEASMLEIPVIAKGFADGKSPYQNRIDSQFMKIVIDDNEWMKEIEPLIQDKELRQTMGKNARKYVIENYDISSHIWKWEEAYKKIQYYA